MFPSAQWTQCCFCLEYRLVLASDNKFGSIPALQVDDRGLNRSKSGWNRVVKDTGFDHFLNGSDLDHRPGVRESIQICCHLPEQVYTPSRYNTGSVGHSETWFAQHTSSYPPLSQLLKYIPSYSINVLDCGNTKNMNPVIGINAWGGGSDLKVLPFCAQMSDLQSKQLICKCIDGSCNTKKSGWIRVLELGENCPWIFEKMSCSLNYNGICRNHYPPLTHVSR